MPRHDNNGMEVESQPATASDGVEHAEHAEPPQPSDPASPTPASVSVAAPTTTRAVAAESEFVTIVADDGRRFTVPLCVAEMSGTLKVMLGSRFREGRHGEPVSES